MPLYAAAAVRSGLENPEREGDSRDNPRRRRWKLSLAKQPQ